MGSIRPLPFVDEFFLHHRNMHRRPAERGEPQSDEKADHLEQSSLA
jgi:hypothetical protein